VGKQLSTKAGIKKSGRSSLQATASNVSDPALNPSGGWLFRQEPTSYSYADLERDGTTLWDGVKNNLARQNLRNVKKGDRVLYYHTGKEKAVVGEMIVVDGPMADPNSDDSKAVVVKVRAVRRWRLPVTLDRIRKDPALAGWDLLRMSRLSVVFVSPAQWQRLEELAAS
jgi:predicted RNA-binding protein with PUA-like domain